jgi:hypothetical protein
VKPYFVLARRCLLILAIILTALSHLGTSQALASEVRILMIAIDRYKNAERIAGFQNLEGAENDLKLIRSTLVRRLNVPDKAIKVLVNESATRAEVLNAFKTHLIQPARDGDIAIFFFAGHGGRLYSAGLTEPDRYDETLITHDAFDPKGEVFGIRDKEVNQLLRELRKKGAHPLVIIDACHAAGATRLLVNGKARMAPAMYSKSHEVVRESAGRSLASDDYILLAATNAKEAAYETDRLGPHYGEFSIALASALNQLPTESTYKDLIRDVRQRMTAAGVSQVAEASGPLDRQLFTHKDLSHLAIEAVRINANLYEIDAGTLVGVSVRSKFDLFRSAFDASSGSNLLGTGEVTDVRIESATVHISSSTSLPAKGFVSETERQFGDFRLNVRVRGSLELVAKANEILRTSDLVNLVQADADKTTKIWVDFSNSRGRILRRDGSEIGTGIDTSQPDWPKSLKVTLERIAKYHAILDIEKQQPIKYIEAQVLLEGGGPGKRKTPESKNGEAQLAANDRILVRVRNRHPSKEMYVNIVALGSDYSVQSLYPTLKGEKSERLAIGAPFETEVFPLKPPHGRDIFVVYATDGPVSLARVMQPGVRELWDHPLAALVDAATKGARSGPLRARVTEWEVQFLTTVTTP